MNPPLNIGIDIYHRGDPYRYQRIDGQFAYHVPGLTWQQHRLSKLDPTNVNQLDSDVVWLDEGKYKRYRLFVPGPGGKRHRPVIQYCLYPTLSQEMFENRVKRAREQADLVLVDHDRLDRWQAWVNVPVRRLAYSTNERYYRDRGVIRDIDVGFYCVYAHNKERPALDKWLALFCARKGYKYGTTEGDNVGTKYAELLARTKVVVHLNRTPTTRPPRIFDTAASGTAMLCNHLPDVSGEHFEPWVHYVPLDNPRSTEYKVFTLPPRYSEKDCSELAQKLEWMIDGGHWVHIAERAKAYVLACHTWQQRAQQLRGILLDVFPRLRKGTETEWMYQ